MASNSFNDQLTQAKATTGRIFRKTLWFAFFALILAGIGYYIYRTYTVSEGTRSGVLYKVSKKGYVFKTYEGELLLAGAQMMTPESIWRFSGSDQAVFEGLEKLEGKSVRCHYREKQDAFPWQGDTNYIIWKIEAIEEEAPAPQVLPQPAVQPTPPTDTTKAIQ